MSGGNASIDERSSNSVERKSRNSLDSKLSEEKLLQEKYRTQQERAKMWKERFVTAGASLGFISAAVTGWLYLSKADSTDVRKVERNTDEAIGTIEENAKEQHEQTEKIRETVVQTTKAVKAVANNADRPDASPSVKVDIPEPPPPTPPPEPVVRTLRR